MVRTLAVSVALAGCTAGNATTPPDPREALAAAFAVPIEDVVEAATVEVDRQPVAIMGRFTRAGEPVAAVVTRKTDASEDVKRELGPAAQLRFAGLVDLAAPAALRTGPRRPVGLKTAGMKQPALVWVTGEKEAAERSPRDSSKRWTGVRERETVFILDFGLQVLLHLEITLRSPDGFGGFTVGGLRLEQRDGKTFLIGTRQDRLPASRARCTRPTPYEVRFERTEAGRFRELPVDPPASDCR